MNKRRLEQAAAKTGELAKRAGRAYMNYSDKAAKSFAEKVRAAADNEKKKAEDVVGNPEPNDPEDVRLYRQIEQNHREVMAQLRAIEDSVDELARPPDEAPGAPSIEQGPADEFDWLEGGFRL